jgi:cytochrome c peroxidase
MGPKARRNATGSILTLTVLLIVAAVHGQGPRPDPVRSDSEKPGSDRDDRHDHDRDFLSNRTLFPNPGGTSRTYSTTGGGIDLTGPFFQSLGTNGRSCATCHQPGDGMSVSAAHIQERFEMTRGLDPIFRTVDGSNCNHDIDVSSAGKRRAAYSLLRTRGLFRIAIDVPATADFDVVSVDNPYSCSDTHTISMYRRPLPTTNLQFLSAVMFDGRESSPATGTTKILYSNSPTALLNDLKHQSMDATTGHAQGDGTRPTPLEQQQIVDFETALFTAQETSRAAGRLDAHGAYGGARPLTSQPFFISINSSLHFLGPLFEPPGGLVTPGDEQPFTPKIFNLFDAWTRLPSRDPRAAIARGQALFNSAPITITGVAGINDDAAAGGLVPGGISTITGTCGTCHDTPNVGNHSFATPLNIGVGDPGHDNPAVSMGGLDISYLPTIVACKKDESHNCVRTTDLGQALVDGRFDHIGKLKGPILRGLSARAPYFHNGSAQTLLDVVHFYEVRFGVVFSPRQEADLVAFLSAL